MSIFKRLLRRQASPAASVAKERLQIIIAHERNQRSSHGPEYLEKLQQEILEVISKYINVDQDQVNVQLQRNDGSAVLELNVAMPESALEDSVA